jgi:predicted ATPase
LNPLVGGHLSTRAEMIQGIRALFLSHGQTVLDTLRNQAHSRETVVLIDSPETGQDFQQSEQVHGGLLKMAETYQVIVATNSLAFMHGGNVIDLGEQTLLRLVRATEKLTRGFASGHDD